MIGCGTIKVKSESYQNYIVFYPLYDKEKEEFDKKIKKVATILEKYALVCSGIEKLFLNQSAFNENEMFIKKIIEELKQIYTLMETEILCIFNKKYYNVDIHCSGTGNVVVIIGN